MGVLISFAMGASVSAATPDHTGSVSPLISHDRMSNRKSRAPQPPMGPVPYGFIKAFFRRPSQPAPTGFQLPYELIRRYIQPQQSPQAGGLAHASMAVASSRATGCGSVMHATSEGMLVAAGGISFIPVVGPELGAVTAAAGGVLGLMGDEAGNACIQTDIGNLNTQLAAQQAEIGQIESQLLLDQNTFWNDYAAIAIGDAQSTDNTYRSAVQAQQNGFTSFMQDTGLWNNGQATVNTLINPSTTQMSDAGDAITQSSFQSNLENIAGITIPTSVPTRIPKKGQCKQANKCYTHVKSSDTTYLIEAYQSFASALNAKIADYISNNLTYILNSSGTIQNITPLFQQYNNSIVGLYQQSIYAMQQSFMMEYSVNQLNYYCAWQAYTNQPGAKCTTSSSQLPSLGGVTPTLYQYNPPQGSTYQSRREALKYNRAQLGLSLLYAAYFNQLYLNTLNYLITDAPIQGQSWPAAGGAYSYTYTNQNGKSVKVKTPGVLTTSTYTNNVGKGLSTAGLNSTGYAQKYPLSYVTPGGSFTGTPLVNTTGAMTNAVLYQYPELQDVSACIGNLTAYLVAHPSHTSMFTGDTLNFNCPSAFRQSNGDPLVGPFSYTNSQGAVTNVNGSYYDGWTLIPWRLTASSPTGTPPAIQLGGTMYNGVPSAMLGNIGLCSASNPAYQWATNLNNSTVGLVNGTPYLLCTNWAAQTFPANNDFYDALNINNFSGDGYGALPPSFGWTWGIDPSAGTGNYADGAVFGSAQLTLTISDWNSYAFQNSANLNVWKDSNEINFDALCGKYCYSSSWGLWAFSFPSTPTSPVTNQPLPPLAMALALWWAAPDGNTNCGSKNRDCTSQMTIVPNPNSSLMNTGYTCFNNNNGGFECVWMDGTSYTFSVDSNGLQYGAFDGPANSSGTFSVVNNN